MQKHDLLCKKHNSIIQSYSRETHYLCKKDKWET